MTIRSRMSSIMSVIGSERLQLFALELEKNALSDLHCSIYKYQPVSSKVGQNIYDSKLSYEFDYGCNGTRTSGLICP